VRSRVSSSVSLDPPRALIRPQPATKTDVPNEKACCRRDRQTARAHRGPGVACADGTVLRGAARRARSNVEAFAEKADELHPDWRETVERAERDGVILRALFIHSLKEARARPDLTEHDQLEIMELEAEFIMRSEIFSVTAPTSAAARGAIRLASVVQKMTLIASLGPKEAERRKRRALSEGGRRGGKKSGKVRARENKPWAPHATELAQVIYSELPDPSDEDVALEIKTRWKLERPVPPGVRTLMRFVSELPKPGKLPKRAK
jgi:hypothetical protein